MEDDVQASSLPEVNSRQLRAVLARLPPRVFDGEALLGPRMKDARPGEKVIRQLRDPSPGRAVLLTAPPERAAPEVDDPKRNVPSDQMLVGTAWYAKKPVT